MRPNLDHRVARALGLERGGSVEEVGRHAPGAVAQTLDHADAAERLQPTDMGADIAVVIVAGPGVAPRFVEVPVGAVQPVRADPRGNGANRRAGARAVRCSPRRSRRSDKPKGPLRMAARRNAPARRDRRRRGSRSPEARRPVPWRRSGRRSAPVPTHSPRIPPAAVGAAQSALHRAHNIAELTHGA